MAPGYVARRIESQIPGIHNRLVSCIDLTANKQGQRYSLAFYRRLVQEAIERIRGFRPGSVLDLLSLRRATLFAGLSAVAFVVAFVLLSDRLPTAMARIFSPFADIPPASGVVYLVQPGDAKVLRGEDLTFSVHVEKGEPDKLRLELRGGGAKEPLWHDLQKQDDKNWRFTLSSANIAPGFEHAFHYRVHGGGTWSKQYRVAVLDRPTIVSLHTVVHYPEYMGLAEPHVGPPQTADVTGPEGSSVHVVVQAEGDVAQGEIQFLKPERRQVAVKERPERVWFEEKAPAGAKTEGTWQWDQQLHQRPTHTEPAFPGTHMHWFHDASEGFMVQPGENVFAYVFIVPDKKPEAIMLEWQDETGWEHRAFWGEDKIQKGKPQTPGHQALGPLPPAGQWVRLEAPAGLVGLQGKTLRGMSFTSHGGQCYWHRAGTLPPGHKEVQEMVPTTTFAMQPAGDNTWSGRFPLTSEGFYRVELRNEAGHPNKTMKEGKFVAIPDNPPQVVLERPGTDLVLSEPSKVPLVVAAYDDFGLADISLAVQRGDSGDFLRQPVKQYVKPQRSDSVVAALDLAAMKLKAGEYVRYRVEARDRKGQTAQTKEFTVRLVADKSGADQQLAALEKTEDTFREKLVKLIADQAKVREAVEKLNAKYAPLSEKIKAAQAEAQAKAGSPMNDPGKPATAKASALELEPQTAKMLEALRKELGELAKQEQQNAQLGQQIAGDIKNTAEQAAKQPLMPQQMAEQLTAMQQLFQQKAVQPLQELAAQMNQGANPRQNTPDLNQMQQLSDRLQKELEAMQSRLQALAGAQKQMRVDASDALAQLKQEMLRQDAGLTARDLETLREFIAALRKELKDLEGKQEQLMATNQSASDQQRSDLNKQQAKLEKQAAKPLTETKELQKSDKMKKMRRRAPDLPNAPYTPETGERAVPPKEEDPDEPNAKTKDKGEKALGKKGEKDKAKEDEEEPLYMPALGGPRPKVDPRFTDKMRPVERKSKKTEDGSESSDREQMAERQAQQMEEMNAAEKSLGSDQEALESMLQQLRQAMNPQQGKTGQPQDAENSQNSQNLAQMMQSQMMQQAMAMAARMRQMAQGQRGQQGQQQGAPTPSQASTGNLQGAPRVGQLAEAELGKLDLETRNLILKMQPKLREELLQGMREEGPEGYRKFIQDYFKRLSKEKSPKNP
jgi:hypothetical protein